MMFDLLQIIESPRLDVSDQRRSEWTDSYYQVD